ncbi:uncharacterized protein il4r.2 [Silurus meridionalis]|uniref:uncharacterized protein il4r.2 n=1 Tax=Silurus meridionalis TaxID=175797 RepID=UPI001EEC9C7B|nr:uncharacterized protein il4r.2 [Silurus meridionalis]XP_046690902.1 uncharacterized protein il4r.2 [Silurus meridionalis]
MIFILYLGFLITFGLTESSEHHTRAEHNLNLECINDYLSEIMCILTPVQLDSCPEYSLNASRDNLLFTCDFKQLNSNACECLLNVSFGFLVNEDFKVKVLKNKNVLFTEIISTTESVKPKKPFIVAVNQTQDGNFHIVWDTEYKTKNTVFNSELFSELTYYVEGNKESRKNVTLNKGQKDYWLVGRNLESNSNYTVRARIKSNLNLIFSDYSDPYWFTTPPSPNNNLKIIIPIVCVILIICIFTMYYCYDKLLEVWWEKIPTPTITTNFVKQVPNLMSFQNDFSPVHLDSSKVVQPGDKTWLGSSLVDVRGENSLNSLGKDGSLSEVVYDQTVNESVEDNNAHWELVQESQPTNLRQTNLMSTKYLKNMKPNSDDIQRERGNSFRFTNKFYMFSGSDELPKPTMGFFDDRNKKEHVFSVGPCTGCLGSKNTSIQDCAPTDQAFISIPNNVNLIMEKQMCSPQNISCETGIIEVENGYKDFQSLLRNSEEQQSLACELELKHLCGPVLHTPPGIQIDSSYHRV